uniref:Amino acid transporter transmembrane domain-containing protein n=1 Tax=Ascaris lumbricoides TaxID=6252 RepID=A0A9J2PWT4_ASCLU
MAFVPALDASYSTNIGYILIFNLIVGTGALALPKAFHSAGCLLGVLLLSISAFMSYVCATFVVEGMAIANAVALRNKLRANKERSEKQLLAAYRIRKRVEIVSLYYSWWGRGVREYQVMVALHHKKPTMDIISGGLKDNANASSYYVCATFVVEGMAIANAVALRNKLRANKERSEKQLLAAYRIRKRVEISGMARLFIGKYGVLLLNIIVAIYLFGDLAVYTVTVPKSIMNIICQSVNASTEHGHNACYDNWPNWLQRIAVYRFTVCLFVCFVTPLVLIGIHRTKFLQLSTSICRWSAIYLFGDLAVYTVTVPKSIMNIICQSVNASTEHGHNACYDNWPNWLQRIAVYRFTVCLFVCFVTPLVLIGIHRTKFLQLSTSICRWSDYFELHIYFICLSETFSQSVNASTEHGHNACYDNWPNWLQRIAVYRFTVCLFVCFVTPLVLIGIHRTKFLQLSTSICRWSAFTLMIVLACIQLAREGSPSMPKMFNIHGFGSLFGTTVYAFMCHHSLPSLVTPMKSKRHIFIYLAMVYVLVSIFYLALAITGTFSFSHIFDVYSLNFLHNKTDTLHEILVNYFLALFPVFTLSSNYPIVACTLINNLTVQVDLISELFFSDMKMQFLGSSAMGFNPHYLYRLFTRKGNDSTCLLDDHSDSDPEIVVVDTISKIGRWRHYAIAFVVIASATLIAFCTDDVLILTSITGSYPGVGVQYIIPSIIAIYGRRFSTQNIGAEVPRAVRSPFSSSLWPTAMLIWSAFTVLMVTLESCHAFTYLP